MTGFLLYRVRAGHCLGCVALLVVPGCLWGSCGPGVDQAWFGRRVTVVLGLWDVTIPSEPERTSGMSWFALLVRSVGRRRSWSTPWAWSPDHGSLR
jgi:hypothetical protein